jgi:DHA1 family bicyclomycin/chloramphenicol resistance-like MFS transporter
MLIAARLFQALGGCAGLVLGRAIVRDTSRPADTARQLALMNLMVTVGPAVAPLAGSVLSISFGWRSIFLLLCLIGIANLLFIALLLPETGRARLNPDFSALARHYRQLISSPAFLGYSIGGGCATTSMYAFIAVAPFIFVNQLHRPEHEVGVYLALLVSGVWLGSFLTSRLIVRIPAGRLLVCANLMSVAAALVLLAATLTGHLSVPLIIACMFLYTVGVGTASPAALSQAVNINPFVIGSASGLYGFAQMAVGAICTAFASLGSDPALAVSLVLAAAGIVAQVSFWIALRNPRNA